MKSRRILQFAEHLVKDVITERGHYTERPGRELTRFLLHPKLALANTLVACPSRLAERNGLSW